MRSCRALNITTSDWGCNRLDGKTNSAPFLGLGLSSRHVIGAGGTSTSTLKDVSICLAVSNSSLLSPRFVYWNPKAKQMIFFFRSNGWFVYRMFIKFPTILNSHYSLSPNSLNKSWRRIYFSLVRVFFLYLKEFFINNRI